MPIYEFVCQNCGHEFEHIQSFSDVNAPDCTSCGSSEVVRRLGRPAIHFKGSGWYITDSKKSKDKNGNSANGSADSVASTTESSDSGAGNAKADSSEKSEKKSESTGGSAKESTTPVAAD